MAEPSCTQVLGSDQNNYENTLASTNKGKTNLVTGATSTDTTNGLTRCLQGKLNYYAKGASIPYEIMDVNESITKKQVAVQIAKDRAASLQNINSKVSFYQSWFPLSKPLKQSSLPVLIGLTLFMFILLFGYLLALIGIEIKMDFPYIQSVFGIYNFNDLITKPIFLLIVACVVLALLLSYFVYEKFMKKE